MSVARHGHILATIVLVTAITSNLSVHAQADKITRLTSKTDIKRELYNYLLTTKQETSDDGLQSVYQYDVLRKARIPGVAIYKFGLNSAHGDYNVVFRYKDRLVFPYPVTTSRLHLALQQFLAQYPTSFSQPERSALVRKLTGIVEYNRALDKSEEL